MAPDTLPTAPILFVCGVASLFFALYLHRRKSRTKAWRVYYVATGAVLIVLAAFAWAR